ncbi:hypothetical protein OG21DRAFT_1509722 [Imleria badia]|nr:hypothetical protein OG21DRAFT_1509722 [Imleria badia]
MKLCYARTTRANFFHPIPPPRDVGTLYARRHRFCLCLTSSRETEPSLICVYGKAFLGLRIFRWHGSSDFTRMVPTETSGLSQQLPSRLFDPHAVQLGVLHGTLILNLISQLEDTFDVSKKDVVTLCQGEARVWHLQNVSRSWVKARGRRMLSLCVSGLQREE